jgi:S1-C subfamily serine protease
VPQSAEAAQWSQSIAAQVVRAAPLLAAIRLASGTCLTGLLWRHDLVVTADSSLPAQEAYAVALANGQTLAARTLRRDPGLGIAALGLVGTAPTAPIEPAARPAVGAVLLALMASPDATPTGRLAVVHSLHSEGRSSPPRIVLDAAPGFLPEGGPVFDDRGALVGLCAGSRDQPPCIVSHAAIADFLGDEPAGALIRRGWIGAALQPVSVAASLRRIAGQATGRLVISLTPNGPADEAGILPGDILLTVDGQRMNGPGSLRSLLGSERIGREVNVRLARNGQIRTRRLTVAAQPVT